MGDFAETGDAASSSAGVKKPRSFYGYAIVSASFLVLMIVYGTQYSFGVFFKPVLAEFGWSRAVTSGAYSLYTFLQGAFAIIAGRLNDRFGPRVVVSVCGVFMGVGYLLMSQTNAVWQIYVFYGALASIGAAGSWVPLLSTVARWFVRRRGLMTGIVTSGIGAGTMIMPPLANQLISSYNWRTSYIIVGSIALVATVITAQFLRRDPSQMGQTAYGTDAIETGNADLEIRGLSLQEAVRTRQFWMISIALFAASFCLQTVMVHIVPHATDLGISAVAAATILSVIGGVSIGSKIGMGSAIDRVGNKPIMVVVAVLLTIAFIWLEFARGAWMLYLFAVVFAVGYGGMAAVQSPVVAEFFGLKAHGAIFGIAFVILATGGAIGPLIAGRIFDTSGSYYPAFMACVALGIVGLIMASLLKPIRKPDELIGYKL